jgi:hypothetical protein
VSILAYLLFYDLMDVLSSRAQYPDILCRFQRDAGDGDLPYHHSSLRFHAVPLAAQTIDSSSVRNLLSFERED